MSIVKTQYITLKIKVQVLRLLENRKMIIKKVGKIGQKIFRKLRTNIVTGSENIFIMFKCLQSKNENSIVKQTHKAETY